nr:MAG TPA: hypothetical protein [Caudoviricetes sp.]
MRAASSLSQSSQSTPISYWLSLRLRRIVAWIDVFNED